MTSIRVRQSCCLAAFSLFLACTAAESAPGEAGGEAEHAQLTVRTGAEVLLSDSLSLVRGKRIGLITNHTGISPSRRATGGSAGPETISTVDVLHDHPDIELVALFGPEHGIRGDAAEGERVDGGVDARTGVPIHSLYTGTLRPPPETLEGLDALVFDIQDVGARYYTYVSTMAYAMEEAGAHGLPFIVLDRPNPIDGRHVQGNVLDPAYSTFVGLYPVPMRHGMTPGELARLYVGEFGIEVELHVVPVDGWERRMSFPETGLPWVAPSPNMPSYESALHYPGTCLFEGTNLSVGRGTDRAFQWIGAPWLDGRRLAEALDAYELPGVRFEAVTFTPTEPTDGKFGGESVEGVRFVATDPEVYDPTRAAVAVLMEARAQSGERWEWNVAHFDRLAGTDQLRRAINAGATLEEAVASWPDQIARFLELRQPYLLYD